MQLEDYLDFDNPNGIRIKDVRINIEVIIMAAQVGLTPAEIVQDFPFLSLEQVHAALAYYYRNRAQMDDYIKRQDAAYDEAKRKHESGERPEVVQRLMKSRAG